MFQWSTQFFNEREQQEWNTEFSLREKEKCRISAQINLKNSQPSSGNLTTKVLKVCTDLTCIIIMTTSVFRPSLTPSSTPGRLPRHPELPPLHLEDNSGPRLKDYLEKPRLVSTLGRKTSRGAGLGQEEVSVEELVPGLAQLTMYYSQTFLDKAGDKRGEANNSAHGNRSM